MLLIKLTSYDVMVGGALKIRVYVVVMEVIINRGALIIIRKARMLLIWVLFNMVGNNKAGGVGRVDMF